jgi:putative ABC transport system substrate-binding protein
MRRREFLAGLGAAVWPLDARAQRRLPTIGILGSASAIAMGPWVAACVQRLRELGWIEGRTGNIELRWADGRPERIAEIAAEFERLHVDVIITTGTAISIIKQTSSTIPLVFAIANDPLGAGLVASLARPGGHITGLSQLAADLGGKRVELIREIIPTMKRLAILGDAGNQAVVPEMRQVQEAARMLGLQDELLDVRRAEEIGPALEALKGKADALYVQSGPLMNTNRVKISTLALAARLPTMSGIRDYVDAGSLVSYGPNFPDMFRRAAEIADKILRGANPGDVPVEQAAKFDLILNLTTAKALGLKIPESFLLRANEVIE